MMTQMHYDDLGAMFIDRFHLGATKIVCASESETHNLSM